MKRFAVIVILLSWSLTAAAVGVDPAAKSITISLTVEPPNLDSSHSEDTTSGFILNLTNEALVRIGRHGQIVPGVADHWKLGEGDATFYLRPDATWADGKPVTARDFVFSWRRLVNPATGAAGSTFFAHLLKNGHDILGGKKPVDSLGVEAIDDHTLHVELSQPVPYLLTVLTGTAFMPLRKDFVEAQGSQYASGAKHLLSNGPFRMVSWVHNGSMVFVKNDKYWDAKDIKLNEIKVGYITADTRSLFNLFKSKELATLALDDNILVDAQRQGARIRRAPTNCVAWLDLNMRPGRPTSNLKLREAIRAAFNRDSYVNNVVSLPGSRRTDTIFSSHIRGVHGTFQAEFPPTPINFDPPKARKLLAEALKQMHLDRLPPLVLLANETREDEAEFIQSQLNSTLGIEVRIDKQTFKQSIAKMNKGDFDLARQAFCSGAITDPVFFAGIFDSRSPFNNGAYHNPEYDHLMDVTRQTGDQTVRMRAFAKMQHLLYRDVPLIPIYEESTVYVQDPRVDGLERFPVTNFSRGFIR